MASPAAPARASARRGFAWNPGLTLSGGLSLAAVLAVVVVVSLPRLRSLAVQENEADARATAEILAGALEELPATRLPTLQELLQSSELASLDDAELLAQGTLLRRHGYLFEVTRLTADGRPALGGEGSGPAHARAVRAWPWAHGRTGVETFLVPVGGPPRDAR